MFPIFLKLEGRRCLVAGAGAVAEGKIRSLLRAGAVVQVVAPEANSRVQEWALDGTIEWIARGFEPNDLDGVFLVIAATSSPELNARIFLWPERKTFSAIPWTTPSIAISIIRR